MGVLIYYNWDHIVHSCLCWGPPILVPMQGALYLWKPRYRFSCVETYSSGYSANSMDHAVSLSPRRSGYLVVEDLGPKSHSRDGLEARIP